MKKILLSALVVASLCLTSCGVTSSAPKSFSETQVVLSDKNFKVVGQAFGESKAVYVFGIGGLSRKTLRSNAINEMSKNAHLTGSQTLTNITTGTSVKMITPFYVEVICTATANIVEFK